MGNNKDGQINFETRGGEKVTIDKKPVGRPVTYVSPYPTAFSINSNKTEPEALKTELTTLHQIRKDEGTLIWGADDALPLHILDAISKSPTTSSCMAKMEQFVNGDGFTDEGLETMVVNKDGQTLRDLHRQLVGFFCPLDGFSTNFKFNSEGKITNAYCIDTSAIRFKAEAESNEISGIKYNPYFGSTEYRKHYTTEYSLFDIENVNKDIKKYGTKFEGQVYFYGIKRPLFKHYPVPKFWSGSKWIYSDAKLATYIDTMLDNGFFSSVLMNVVGNPNKMSEHPDSMRDVTGTDGVVRKQPTKTEGEIFGEMMAANFSGVQKAAKALVTWSANKDQSVNIQPFPTNTNFDFVSGTLRETIRMITIATEVPGILCNLPDEVSPLAGQDVLKNASEAMQNNTASKRFTLENFYNNILIPNMAKTTKAKVQIKPYQQTKVQITVDDKFWEFMNESEKIKFIEENEPSIQLNRPPQAEANTAPPTVDKKGNIVEAPTVPQVDEVLKGLKVSEINRILSIVKKVNSGQLTNEQAKTILSGYGLNDEQINAFLNPNPVEV